MYRVAQRESGFNPKVHHLSYWGLMQISASTARSMGYNGPLEGLLDANTNLTYAIRYLAGAYNAAHGNEKSGGRFLFARLLFETQGGDHQARDRSKARRGHCPLP